VESETGCGRRRDERRFGNPGPLLEEEGESRACSYARGRTPLSRSATRATAGSRD